jgi:hypothetical protein
LSSVEAIHANGESLQVVPRQHKDLSRKQLGIPEEEQLALNP